MKIGAAPRKEFNFDRPTAKKSKKDLTKNQKEKGQIVIVPATSKGTPF